MASQHVDVANTTQPPNSEAETGVGGRGEGGESSAATATSSDRRALPPIITRANQHDGSEHLSVNNTWWRRWLVLAGTKTTARLYRRKGQRSSPYRISPGVVVKMDCFTHLAEAANMQYVAANTTVPVPRVYCAFVHKNRAYIAMERVKGRMLSQVLHDLRGTDGDEEKAAGGNQEAIDALLAQLKAMVAELRALPPPPGVPGCVASASGGSLRDHRIARQDVRFGPFRTIQEFHFWLRQGLRLEDCLGHPDDDEHWTGIKDMVAWQDGPFPPSVFTHGDLNESNIMVRDGKVASIIDWETAGWYPSYWEYTSSWHTAPMREAWRNMLSKFIPPCSKEELEMDITRQRHWGEI